MLWFASPPDAYRVPPTFGIMSYFATLAGVQLDERVIDGVRLVPADQAQPYLRDLAGQISTLDGSPLYLCDDGSTGTSHEIVCEAIDAGQSGGNVSATRVAAVLRLCEMKGCTFRAWDAGATAPGWPDATRTCRTVTEAVATLSGDEYPHPWEMRFAPNESRSPVE